jgi:hypothetical protein
MAGQIQFMFANPIKRKKGNSMRKRVTKKSNPFKFIYQKGRGKKIQGTRYLTDSEFKNIREGSKAINKTVMKLKQKMRSVGNQVTDPTFKSLSSQLKNATAKQKKLNSSLQRAIAKRRKAEAEFKKYNSQGYDVVDSDGKEIKNLNRSQMKAAKKALFEAEQLEKKIDKEIKKMESDLKKKKGGGMAKKKAKKKATKKKASSRGRKKVAKKKVTKKKATKKKATKKKATKKKATKKKATKKKVAKKASKKKVTRRKVAKKSTRRKASKKKATKRKPKTINVKTRKKYNAKKKTMAKGSTLVHKFKSAGRGKQKGRKYSTVKRTKRTNPIFGGKMKKLEAGFKKYLKHDISEAGGLLAGGFTYQVANSYARKGLEKIAPNVLSKLESGVLGNYIGSLMPILIAVGVDQINKKALKKNAQLDALSKGLIGAGVVGLGVSLHEQILGGADVPAGVEGYSDADLLSHDHSMKYDMDMGSIQTEDFGMIQTEDFGNLQYENFGAIETEDFGHADANMEFADFQGEMEL